MLFSSSLKREIVLGFFSVNLFLSAGTILMNNPRFYQLHLKLLVKSLKCLEKQKHGHKGYVF